jgi:hypothetical protein
MPLDPADLPLTNLIAAVGALGTAAFALVDGSKAFGGGVSNCGFGQIEAVVTRIYPVPTAPKVAPVSQKDILQTLKANWLNGTALADQKAIAKSLIKLGLDDTTADYMAAVTGVDPGILKAVATDFKKGTTPTPEQSAVYGRFDLILTAMLDQGYQRADQIYRNKAKLFSMVASVILAIVGVWVTGGAGWMLAEAAVLGLLATPLAPISKDLSSALVAGVKVAQGLRK